MTTYLKIMSKIKKVKQKQLGMNPSTASGRLVKDILFYFIQQNGYVCFQCNKSMSRKDFSIEHKTPWLHSLDPVGLYFDLSNISFSHLKCNVNSARPKKRTVKCPSYIKYRNRGCRCKGCTESQRKKVKKERLARVELTSEPS